MYLRDRGGVTGDNEVILIAVRRHAPIGGGVDRFARARFRQRPPRRVHRQRTKGDTAR